MRACTHTHTSTRARTHTHTDTGTHKPWLRDTRGLAPSLVFSPQSRLPPRLLVCVCLCDFVLCGPCACQHARILRRVYVLHARILRRVCVLHARILRRVYVSVRTHDSKDREVPQQACAVPCCDLSDGCPRCHNHARGCGSIRQTGHLSLIDMHVTQHVQSLHAALTVKLGLLAGV